MRRSILIGASVAIIGAVAAVTLLLMGFSPSPAVTVEAMAPVGKTTYQGREVDMFTFRPSPLIVQTGTRVVFRNGDPVNSHTITSDGGVEPFVDSGILRPGESFSVIFGEPGSFTYHCNIHPWTKGTIEITA